ncbi:hypothetical protein [Thiothrix winogradskyi]|uniref:Uncharacterized protein n=1 Tax=Thiothrix winogradskyi TaxID=96472 RepID=A0ABY3T4P1_9GAMM|nr:hypothetical protein [Thiothrix winogradskyi]UJS26232.1 hypothetical protein L2Y54_09395 [Thiothrix winogradskyi]
MSNIILDKQDLANRVKNMVRLMAEVSGEMEYFGGLNKDYTNKARELANAAAIAWEWHETIQADAGSTTPPNPPR